MSQEARMRAWVLGSAFGAALICSSPAAAVTQVILKPHKHRPAELIVRADDGDDRISIHRGKSRTYRVESIRGIKAESGCRKLAASSATCGQKTADPRVRAGGGDDVVKALTPALLAGEDGDDRLIDAAPEKEQPRFLGFPGLIGGPGDDVLKAGGFIFDHEGGPGDDLLIGTDRGDSMDGNAGDDTFRGKDGGLDFFLGGAGADTYIGGPGFDKVLYYGHKVPVRVDFDGDRDDGAPGEGDLIGADVEGVLGTELSDVLIGDDGPNELEGDDGRGSESNDTLIGNGGDDTLIGGKGADVAEGGEGDDELFGDGLVGEDFVLLKVPAAISGADNADQLSGGPGDDLFWSGAGFDQLDLGPGKDRANAEGAEDLVRARDGEADTVDCGTETDEVEADATDQLTDCEVVALP